MMQLQHRTCRLALAACLLIAGSWAGGVWAQSVVINGVQLITSHPPMTMAGSMLLPMRDVFEALNSDVKWRESDQRITATRGAIEIELWIGKTSALVNGQQRLLPIAPMLVNGSTYVPLRFPAEAFGGSVEWDAAARTALINIPPAQDAPAVPQLPAIPQPVVNPEPVANPQPVVQQPTTAEGTVIQLVQAPAGIVLQDADTGGLEAVQVSQNTVITRGVVGDVPQPVALGEARIGDYAQAVLAQGNLAARVVLTYGQVEGKIVAIAGNTLVLDDGTAFHLSESVRVFDPMGQPLALTAVTQNTPGQVVFEPHSKIVYELRLRAQPEPPQQQAPPQILTVGLLNNTTFFRRGDVLKLQLRGTPGGQAVVSIERLVDNLPLGEVQPGVYEGAYTISARDDWRGLAIAGDLTVGGVPAETVVPQTRVVIDNTPPTIAGMSPTDGSLVPNSSPIIGLAFRAGGEAPIDLRSARLWVNGRDVSNGLQVYADEMDYVAQYLRPGLVDVRATVRDLAGNEADANWTFTVVRTEDNPIRSVYHQAPGTPIVGNSVIVIVQVANPGGVGTFDVGNLRKDLPMRRRGASDIYEGNYVIQPGDRLSDAPLTVKYRDPQGHQGTMNSTAHLNIDTTLPTTLRLVQPTDRSQAGETITANGEAPPNSRVRVTVGYATRLLITVNGQLWQGIVSANSRGLWQTPRVGTSLGILGRADEYTVLAQLLDARGNIVSQQQVRLLPQQATQPVTLEGRVNRVSLNPSSVVLRLATGAMQTLPIGPATVLTRGAQGQAPAPAKLADAQVGEWAQATGVPGAAATQVVFTYGQAVGKVVSVAGNTITFEDGSSFPFGDALRVVDAAGKPLPLAAAVKGATGQVNFEPHSKAAYGLRITALPPVPPVKPQPVTLEGVVTGVSLNPSSVVLRLATGAMQTLPIGPATVLTRGAQGQAPAPAKLADAQVGEWAQATGVPGAAATQVAFTYGQAVGKVVSVAGNTITFEDGSSFPFGDALRVVDAAGKPLPLAAAVKGATGQVNFEPHSKAAYGLRITALPPVPPVKPQPVTAPQIESVSSLNKSPYLKRGDVLNLQLKGTPGGQATVSAGRLFSDLPLPEVKPGLYQVLYTVVARQNMRSQPLTGDLAVGGVKALTVTSPTRIFIDITPLSVTGKQPLAGEVIANVSPLIALDFEESGSASLDLAASRLWVNAQEVTEAVVVGDGRLAYQAQNLSAGTVTVKAELCDLAGNVTPEQWAFTITPVAANPLQAVFHDATGPLVTGSLLTVTAQVANPGGVATLGLGNLRTDLPMTRKGTSNLYEATYAVHAGDKADRASVTVSYRDPQGKQGTMAATAPVDIDTKLPSALKVTDPEDGSLVGNTIVVVGRAAPNSRVRVTVTFGMGDASKLKGQLWQATVIASVKGLWRTPEIGSSLGSPGLADQYTVLAELLNAKGKVASQQQIELHR